MKSRTAPVGQSMRHQIIGYLIATNTVNRDIKNHQEVVSYPNRSGNNSKLLQSRNPNKTPTINPSVKASLSLDIHLFERKKFALIFFGDMISNSR